MMDHEKMESEREGWVTHTGSCSVVVMRGKWRSFCGGLFCQPRAFVICATIGGS